MLNKVLQKYIAFPHLIRQISWNSAIIQKEFGKIVFLLPSGPETDSQLWLGLFCRNHYFLGFGWLRWLWKAGFESFGRRFFHEKGIKGWKFREDKRFLELWEEEENREWNFGFLERGCRLIVLCTKLFAHFYIF